MDKETLDSLNWFLANYRVVATHHKNYTDGCSECDVHISRLFKFVREAKIEAAS